MVFLIPASQCSWLCCALNCLRATQTRPSAPSSLPLTTPCSRTKTSSLPKAAPTRRSFQPSSQLLCRTERNTILVLRLLALLPFIIRSNPNLWVLLSSLWRSNRWATLILIATPPTKVHGLRSWPKSTNLWRKVSRRVLLKPKEVFRPLHTLFLRLTNVECLLCPMNLSWCRKAAWTYRCPSDWVTLPSPTEHSTSKCSRPRSGKTVLSLST
mmetsp:Transcript_14515/g.20596  ORF Transcript_14515/g.20596 Transcript_14515/m.20596 type:complete len:212 (+) Transcript_14515:537-1172(+)